jgi:hypothetical protein
MNNLLDVIVFKTAFSWSLLFITLLMIAVVPRLFGLNYLTGLIFAQMTLFFNAVPIIAGLDTQIVSVGRSLHFYIIEFSFLVLIFGAYRHLLLYRERVLQAFEVFFSGPGAFYFSALVVAIAAFNYALVPTDGSSRIEYMTASWFSLLKPLIQLTTPLSYFGIFVLLSHSKRRFLGYLLLATAVGANIATGSKASFVFSLFTSFLALRDLSGASRLQIRPQDKWKILVFVVGSVIFALSRLEASINDVFERFFLFSDATILTYFSDYPTAACQNLSIFASMHRGWARLLGDPSALDVDTLFGFALTIQELGVNTFTGPNGRLSAYVLCNFPEERVVFGIFVILVYLWLMRKLFKRLLCRPTQLAILYPFLTISLGGASQDFNLIMQDITLFVMLLLTTLSLYSVQSRRQYG